MAGLRQGSKAEIRTREEKSLHSSFCVTRLPSTDKSIFFPSCLLRLQGLLWFFFFIPVNAHFKPGWASRKAILSSERLCECSQREYPGRSTISATLKWWAPMSHHYRLGFFPTRGWFRVGLTTKLHWRVQWGNAQWGETARRVVMLFMSVGRACSRQPKFCFCKEQTSTGPSSSMLPAWGRIDGGGGVPVHLDCVSVRPTDH